MSGGIAHAPENLLFPSRAVQLELEASGQLTGQEIILFADFETHFPDMLQLIIHSCYYQILLYAAMLTQKAKCEYGKATCDLHLASVE